MWAPPTVKTASGRRSPKRWAGILHPGGLEAADEIYGFYGVVCGDDVAVVFFFEQALEEWQDWHFFGPEPDAKEDRERFLKLKFLR